MAWETIAASFAPIVLDAIGGIFSGQDKPPMRLDVPGGPSRVPQLNLGGQQEPSAPWSQTLLGRSALALASPLWQQDPTNGVGEEVTEAVVEEVVPGGPQGAGGVPLARMRAAQHPGHWTQAIPKTLPTFSPMSYARPVFAPSPRSSYLTADPTLTDAHPDDLRAWAAGGYGGGY